MFSALAEADIDLRMVNIGGGFPAHYSKEVPEIEDYARAVMTAVTAPFRRRPAGDHHRAGPFAGGDAGIIQSEVVLISAKGRRRRPALGLSRCGQVRRARRDHGREHQVPRSSRPTAAARRPRCARRADLRQRRYPLREDRISAAARSAIGDKVEILSAGAYTASYASVGFNGFPPIRTYCI